MALKLYELAQWESRLLDRLDTDDAEKLPTAAEIDALCAQMADKVQGCCKLIKSIDAESKALMDESARLAARAKTAGDRVAFLKGYVLSCLRHAQERKLSAGIFTVRIQANSAPRVLVENIDALPPQFINEKTVRTPDTAALIAAKEADEPLPSGVTIERGEHLRIS